MATLGMASTSATERFRQRFASLHASHFRSLQDLWAPSIGLGTYLGDADDATDERYALAIREAVARGGNLFDTATNYRCQRSERILGRTITALITEGVVARDEVILCTKGGYIPFDGAVPRDPARYVTDSVITPGLASFDELVNGCHCLAPAFLDASLQQSLANLRIQTIDVYYLHNPEEQLEFASREVFEQRLSAAFALLERRAQEGKIRYYGLATWNGLRCPASATGFLSLERVVELARAVGGATHRCRVIQAPYNLAMPELFSFKNQQVEGEAMTLLESATRLGISVVASASLLQSRLNTLPKAIEARIPGLATAPQRAIQFVRSTPGIVTALVGMQRPSHVTENLALAQYPLLPLEELRQLFNRSNRSFGR